MTEIMRANPEIFDPLQNQYENLNGNHNEINTVDAGGDATNGTSKNTGNSLGSVTVAHDFAHLNRTEDVRTTVTFQQLAISEKILAGLELGGFNQATPIQVKSIPYLRQNYSLIIHGKSGT